MEEIWKDIKGYEGLYQISNLGRVKSLGNGESKNHAYSKERILKPGKDEKGYFRVCLCKDGKHTTKKVHRLAAQAFLPNPFNLPQINHKDEVKSNNSVDNLEWCDNQYNCDYSKSKRVICVETNVTYKSIHEAERQTGVNFRDISRVCLGKRQTAGGYHWEFTY